MIDIIKKKNFIRWFLTSFQFPSRESTWALNYFLSDDSVMNRVHFVSDPSLYNYGISVGTICSKQPHFNFYNQGILHTDAVNSFHMIRSSKEDELYLTVRFKGQYLEDRYIALLEDEREPNTQLSKEDIESINTFMERSHLLFKIQQVKKEIDVALDKRDFDTVKSLSLALNQYNNRIIV